MFACACLLHPLAALAVDTDGDGLEDADETGIHGTNPALYDTDGDGVHDGDEVLHYPTDPLDDDSDDDGLLDGEEQLSESGFGPARDLPLIDPTDQPFLVDIDKQGGLDLMIERRESGFGYRLNQLPAVGDDFGPYQHVSDIPLTGSHIGGAGTEFWLDADGDGDPDLFRGAWTELHPSLPGPLLHFWENRVPAPSADFATPVALDVSPPVHLHPADMNGDEIPDFVAAWDFAPGLAWHERTSLEVPPPFEQYGLSLETTDLFYGGMYRIADVDGDGDLDVTTSWEGGYGILWRENRLNEDQFGDFAPESTLVEIQRYVTAHAIIDLFGTGIPQIIVIAGPSNDLVSGTKQLLILENPFASVRAAPARSPAPLDVAGWYAPPQGYPDFISSGDIDGDGDLDLLVSSFSDLSWVENDLDARIPRLGPSRSIVSSGVYNLPSTGEQALTDLDGDGDLDAFDGAHWYENVIHSGSDPLLDDSDEDGLLDGVEVATHGTHPGRADSDGDGLTDDEEIDSALSDPLDPDSDDDGLLDGDERASTDFTVAGLVPTGRTCCVFESIFIGPNVELTDVDADGDPDVVTGGDSGAGDLLIVNRINESTRSLVVEDSPSWVLPDGPPPTFTLVRGDDDEPIAAIVSGSFFGKVTWLPALYDTLNGFGGFPYTGIDVTTTIEEADHIVAADLDRDGDADVIVSDRATGEVGWFANRLDEPSADFAPIDVVDAAAAGVEGAFAADLDGDEDLDLLVAAHDAEEIRWFENRLDEPSADFGPANLVSAAAPDPFRLHAVDFDGDGDLDPVASIFTNGVGLVYWYENRLDSAEAFVARPIDSTPFGWDAVTALDGADLDRDGDDDVVFVQGAQIDQFVAVLSNGTDTPGEAQVLDTGASWLGDVGLGDLDGDGDLDAVITGQQHIAWIENRINFATGIDDPDSDDDGLLDGFEVGWGFDPLDTTETTGDEDGDGLDLLAEQAAGTSPLTDDTDGDTFTDDVELAQGSDPTDRRVIPVPEFGSGGFVVAAMAALELLRRRRAG